MFHDSSYYKLVTCSKCRLRKAIVAGEYPDIVTAICGNCKESNEEVRILHRVIPAVNWVKTSEQPPEENQEILFVLNSDDLIKHGTFEGERFREFSRDIWFIEDIAYWMPAPKLPEEEK